MNLLFLMTVLNAIVDQITPYTLQREDMFGKMTTKRTIIETNEEVKKGLEKLTYSDPKDNFWNKYTKADYLKKKKIVAEELFNAPIWKEILKNLDMPNILKNYTMSSLLSSYFDDLIEFIEDNRKNDN